MGGGNSADRRKNRRHQRRKLFWFVAEHQLLASGVGAMLITAITLQITGFWRLAIVPYVLAWSLLLLVLIRAKAFRISPILAYGALAVSASGFFLFWLLLNPVSSQSVKELAKEIAKELPSQQPQPSAQQIPSPSPATLTSAPVPTPTADASPKTRGRKIRTKRSGGLTAEEKWILRQLNSNKNAHANAAQQNRITKEQLKRVLAKRLTKRGVDLLIKQVRERGIVFVLTPEIEQELRELAKQHGNISIDGLMTALNELSFLPRLEGLRSDDGVLLSLIKGIQIKRKFDELQMLDTLMKKAGYSGPILMSDLVITNDVGSKDNIRVGISEFRDSKSGQVNPGSQYIFPDGSNITKAYVFAISDVTIHISYRVANDQTLPFRDWIRSDEAKQLITRMTDDVEKLADEGRVMDLSDYDNALKSFYAWIDKCSIGLGRLDIQMRRFNRSTNYKFKWDSNSRQVIEIFGDKDRKKEMLRLKLNSAIAELDLVKANIRTETLPEIPR